MKLKVLSLFSLTPVLLLTGCGETQVGKSVSLKMDPAAQSANLEVEMSQGLEVSLAGEFPISDGLGSLYFVPATRESNAKIGLKVNIAKLVDDKVHVVSSLPSGAPFPVAVRPPLFAIPISKTNDFDLEALFSLVPELQVGATIGIKAFNTNYVIAGVAICQNFRNSESRAYAAVCLYGPNTATGRSGGIFLGGTFGEVIKSEMLVASEESAPNAVRMMAFSPEPAFQVAASELLLDAQETVSEDFDTQMHDPNKQLSGSKGLKTLRNVQKILKVRH